MSGSRGRMDEPGPAAPEHDKPLDWSEDARPGLDLDDGATRPEQVAPNVIAPDLDRPASEPDLGPL